MKWRMLLAVLFALLGIWGILPYVIGRIRGVGVITPVVIGVIGVLCTTVLYRQTVLLFTAILHAGRGMHIAVGAVAVAVALLILLFLVVSVMMIAGAVNPAPKDTPVTVVVLGAQIRGDRPSLMLSHRLDAAAKYLKAHPDAPCVVSGGQGEDEAYTEAHIMSKYLQEKGIDAARIYEEDASTSTMENMLFSKALIQKEQLPQTVVVATQEFHQYRAARYAERAALQPVGTVTCSTPWYLFLCYWVREFAGICRMWILGY